MLSDSMETGAIPSLTLTHEILDYHLQKNFEYHLRLVKNYTSNMLGQFEIKLNSIANASTSAFVSSTNAVKPLNAANSNSFDELDQKLQSSNSRIDMLQNYHQNLLNDMTRLQKVNENLKLENRILKEELKEVKQKAQDLHKTLAINQVSILALEERLINLEKISCDGTLLWRINNVSERIQEAKSGKNLFIFIIELKYLSCSFIKYFLIF